MEVEDDGSMHAEEVDAFAGVTDPSAAFAIAMTAIDGVRNPQQKESFRARAAMIMAQVGPTIAERVELFSVLYDDATAVANPRTAPNDLMRASRLAGGLKSAHLEEIKADMQDVNSLLYRVGPQDKEKAFRKASQNLRSKDQPTELKMEDAVAAATPEGQAALILKARQIVSSCKHESELLTEAFVYNKILPAEVWMRVLNTIGSVARQKLPTVSDYDSSIHAKETVRAQAVYALLHVLTEMQADKAPFLAANLLDVTCPASASKFGFQTMSKAVETKQSIESAYAAVAAPFHDVLTGAGALRDHVDRKGATRFLQRFFTEVLQSFAAFCADHASHKSLVHMPRGERELNYDVTLTQALAAMDAFMADPNVYALVHQADLARQAALKKSKEAKAGQPARGGGAAQPSSQKSKFQKRGAERKGEEKAAAAPEQGSQQPAAEKPSAGDGKAGHSGKKRGRDADEGQRNGTPKKKTNNGQGSRPKATTPSDRKTHYDTPCSHGPACQYLASPRGCVYGHPPAERQRANAAKRNFAIWYAAENAGQVAMHQQQVQQQQMLHAVPVSAGGTVAAMSPFGGGTSGLASFKAMMNNLPQHKPAAQ